MSYTNGLDKPSDFFNTVLYTGNSGSGDNVVNVNFQPDFTWFKSRTQAYPSYLIDAVRGDEKYLNSSNTNAEASWGVDDVTWTSTGFTLNTTGGSGINEGGQGANNMVAWNWKAGTSFTNDASATGVGSIDSTGSVNTDAGFSIISYTGTGSTGTVAHGLGAVPKMMIIKGRSFSDAWIVYHKNIGATKDLRLNLTNAASTNSGPFNNTEPTSSLFTVGSGTATNNGSATFIAYCFAEKQGYSKFGSYVGNGSASSGTFTYLGFKPSLIILKRTDSTADWKMYDNKRNSGSITNGNPNGRTLKPNSSAAEGNAELLDFLSNGFKHYNDNGTDNESGATYIFMAFAENPLVTSTGVPATAR